MSGLDRPWFVGAWRRRSIAVPGGAPIEPCEAWWIQAGESFVDVRVVLPGHEHNDLPYSSTRAFAGRFDVASGAPCWHVEIDSDGVVPRTDRGAARGLVMDPDDPLLMIEDAPGRFREEWVQCAADGDVEFVHSAGLISVRVGDVVGVVLSSADGVRGWVWCGDRSVAVGAPDLLDRQGRMS